jgi:LmbE family N-acetylglucosaminyl deacetylase
MRVLAVGCHPDDVEISAGGTLRKYAKRGHDVFICHLANGDKGDVQMPMAELGALRNREAEAGGARLGAREVISLNVSDLMVNSRDEAQLRMLMEVLCHTRPDVIFTHSPNDYMKDHAEVSKMVFDVSFSATIPHVAGSGSLESVTPIVYMDTLTGVDFSPEHYVDISGEIEDKIRALRCHESQLKWMRDHDHIDFGDMVRTCSKYRGFQCGVAYAEGFTMCKKYLRLTTRQILPLD